MMKHLLFAILFLGFGAGLNAQLASGATLSGNITGDDVVTGEKIDVMEWLDDGKTVVIDVFATWCGPCWGFHATGWLEDMNHLYGPEGTDQIRVLGVEADGSTPVANIMTNQFGQPGSWVTNPNTLEPINYSIIDNPSAASTLAIAYYPTLYIIRPDRKVVEIGGYRYNEEFWLAAMNITPGSKAFVSGNLPTASFCGDSYLMPAQTVDVQNMSDAPMTSATFNVYGNGEIIETIEYNGPEVGVFQSTSVSISAQNFTEATELSVGVAEVNGDMYSHMINGSINKYKLNTDEFTFEFTTDFYPVEISWLMLDDTGAILESAAYTGPANGGGADANKTFSYPITKGADINCLTILFSDSYGDGYTAYNPATHPVPGYAITDADGNVIKEAAEGGFFFDSLEESVDTEKTSSLPNLDALESSKLYPNPVSDVLNVELEFNQTIDYSVQILNAYGQIVRDLGRHTGSDLNTQVDVIDLSSGMYMISVVSELGQKTIKFNKI